MSEMINREFDIKLQTVDCNDTKKLRIILESNFKDDELHEYFKQFTSETEITDVNLKQKFAESILNFLINNSK